MRIASRPAASVALFIATVSICFAEPNPEQYTYKGDIAFDIASIPVSRSGSNLVFTTITGDNAVRYQRTGFPQDVPGVYLRSVHGERHSVFRIELLQDGRPVTFRAEATPSFLRFVAEQGDVEFRISKSGRFRTAHGLATEALARKAYKPDSYWRGPVWAPVTMLLAEGLDASGEHAMARKLRQDFCEMAQQSEGTYENFDALSGKRQRVPAYTWTSSVYLIFAHQLLMEATTEPPNR